MNPLKEKFFPQFISRILVLLLCVSVLTTYSAAQKMVDFNNLTSKRVLSTDAPQVTPILVSGNPDCADLNGNNATFPSITSNFGFKLDGGPTGTFPFTAQGSARELTGGAPSDPNNTVTTTVTGRNVDFSSTRSINAVIIKGGPNANVYVYDPATMSGQGLTTPGGNFGVSHIEFCYGSTASVTIIKEVSLIGGGTASSTAFPFTASGLAAAMFSLVDDDAGPGIDNYVDANITAFGPGNQITVTENSTLGFRLNDISCTGGTTAPTLNPAGNLNGGFVTITVQPGDAVRCIFRNGQLSQTAAGADISGRVLASNGRPISRAMVTVFNTNTLESSSVITNRYGYFGFQEMTVGDFYLISVNSKGYWFATNNQGIGLTGNLTEIEFVGTPFNNPVFGTSIFNDVIKTKGNQP